MNKRGFIGDYLFYIVILFVFSIVIVSAYYTLSNINTKWQNVSQIPTESKTILGNFKTKFLSVFDWFIVTIMVGLLIGIVLLALVVRAHPAFVGIAILMLIIVGGIGVRLSNAFNVFATSTNIVSAGNEFTLLPMIMNNLPKFITLLFIIFIIVLYAKSRSNAIL